MYKNVLGVVYVRQKQNEYLYDVFCDVSDICDDILVLDPENILQVSEAEMIRGHFNADILQLTPKELDYNQYCPEWVVTCYNDERPSRNFKYMKVGLFLDPFMNQWLVKMRYLWGDVEHYRVDIPWNNYEIPIAYRYIEEIDYKWDLGLVPCNQPGPAENCMLGLYSYRYLTDTLRSDILNKFLRNLNSYDYEERKHFESLMKSEIIVEQAVD